MTRFRNTATALILGLGLLGLLGSTSSARAAGAADPTGLKAVFEARYAEMTAAMDRRDPKAVAAFWTVDFVTEDASGKTDNAATMLQKLAAIPVDPNRTSDTKVTSVTLKGDIATVEQRYRMTTSRLKMGSRTDQETVETRATSIDTWLRSGKTWLLQRTVTREIQQEIDGKVVGHKTHA